MNEICNVCGDPGYHGHLDWDRYYSAIWSFNQARLMLLSEADRDLFRGMIGWRRMRHVMNYVPSGGSWDLGGPNVTNENTTDEKIVDHETDALYPKLDGLYTPPGWTPEMTKWYNEHNGSFAKAGTPAAKYEDAVRKGWNNPDDYFQSFEDVMSSIYDEAYELIVEKQRGYGSKNIEQLGLYGVFSRVAYDKIERLKKALSGTVENGVVHIETTPELNDAVEDAALDIINYMVIFIALWRGLWGKPLQEELELERGY